MSQKMNDVLVGPFSLPGLGFAKGQINEDLRKDMEIWASESNCGICQSDKLWVFKTDSQRLAFKLRWADVIPEVQYAE